MHDGPDVFVHNHEQWRRCITVDCGIALTRDYIETRLKALADPNDHTSRRFTQRYGPDHYRAVVSWFERAAREAAAGAASR